MNEREIFLKAEDWIKQGLELAIITVIQTWGSSPRPIGSSMVINSNNEIIGSVSGGCVESFVFSKALDVLKNNKHLVLEFGVTNSQAWEVGLTCGGKLKVLIEKFTREDLSTIKKINSIYENNKKVILASDLHSGERKLIEGNYETIKTTSLNNLLSEHKNSEQSKILLIEKSEWFLKVFASQHKIIIIGAVHISEPLIELANILNFKIFLIDPRNNFKNFKSNKNVIFINEWPDEGLKKVNINNKTSIVTLTHDPKLDDPALIFSLRSAAAYIGCLGSRKTHVSRIKRLKRNGFSEKELKKLHGPVGININAKTPSEIACSILSQIIERKNKYDI